MTDRSLKHAGCASNVDLGAGKPIFADPTARFKVRSGDGTAERRLRQTIARR
jgi:hypothetical protein